jgi:hypothetical protein
MDIDPTSNIRPVPLGENGRLEDFAKLVASAGILLDLLGAGLAAGDVDQPAQWGRVLLFVAFGLVALGVAAASRAIVIMRGVDHQSPEPPGASTTDDVSTAQPVPDPDSFERSRADRAAWYTWAGALFLAAAISLAGVAFASDAGAGTSSETPSRGGETQRGSERDDELAREFRPVLLFDSGEQWRPLKINTFLAEERPDGTRHLICGPMFGQCTRVTNEEGFLRAISSAPSLGQDMYLDFASKGVPSNYSAPRLDECLQRTKLECDGAPSAIYYKVTFHSGLFFIDYWWFLRFNNVDRFQRTQRWLKKLCRFQRFRTVCFDHEGDWEGVTVVVSGAPEHRLDAVIFAAHEWTLLRTASQIMTASGRPLVFIARGSHAAYPGPCRSRCGQPLKRKRFRWPEGQHDGSAAWARNPDKDCFTEQPCVLPLQPLIPSPDPTWTDWPGNWGHVCQRTRGSCRLGDGPKSPGSQKRYRTPWCTFGASGPDCTAVVDTLRGSAG